MPDRINYLPIRNELSTALELYMFNQFHHPLYFLQVPIIPNVIRTTLQLFATGHIRLRNGHSYQSFGPITVI